MRDWFGYSGDCTRREPCWLPTYPCWFEVDLFSLSDSCNYISNMHSLSFQLCVSLSNWLNRLSDSCSIRLLKQYFYIQVSKCLIAFFHWKVVFMLRKLFLISSWSSVMIPLFEIDVCEKQTSIALLSKDYIPLNAWNGCKLSKRSSIHALS